MLKIREMNRNLSDIGNSIDNLLALYALADREGDITGELTKMRMVTCDLQRSLSTPAIIEGYRLDFIQQVQRVGELVAAMGTDPDYQQLLAIGLAQELAVEKLGELRGMICMAEKCECFHTEHRLLAEHRSHAEHGNEEVAHGLATAAA